MDYDVSSKFSSIVMNIKSFPVGAHQCSTDGELKGGGEAVCCIIVKPNKSSSKRCHSRWGGLNRRVMNMLADVCDNGAVHYVLIK